jgi:predicted nucleic acid-binding protein
MNQRIADTSVIVFLAKLDRLELLRLGVEEVLVPSAVLTELRIRRDEATDRVERHLGTWLKECRLVHNDLLQLLSDLGHGEREVIAQAVQEKATNVALDDQEARRVARRSGLESIGTIGILLAAKKQALIPSLQQELERLRGMGFWVTEALAAQVLPEAGEA